MPVAVNAQIHDLRARNQILQLVRVGRLVANSFAEGERVAEHNEPRDPPGLLVSKLLQAADAL